MPAEARTARSKFIPSWIVDYQHWNLQSFVLCSASSARAIHCLEHPHILGWSRSPIFLVWWCVWGTAENSEVSGRHECFFDDMLWAPGILGLRSNPILNSTQLSILHICHLTHDTTCTTFKSSRERLIFCIIAAASAFHLAVNIPATSCQSQQIWRALQAYEQNSTVCIGVTHSAFPIER